MASVCVNVDRRGYSESQEGKGNTMHYVELEVHSTHLQVTLSSDPQKLMTTYPPSIMSFLLKVFMTTVSLPL
jgi:hypothetical protein